MDLHTVLKQGITFGPFKTAHHQSIVNAEFQAAFLRHIAEAVVPNLTIGTDRVEGTVRAMYDQEKYFGPRSAVKFKYSFEGTFYQGQRRETVDLGMAFEPLASGFRLVFEEPRIMTARTFERHDEQRAAERRQLERETDAVFERGRSVADHWQSCARIWTGFDAVVGAIVGPVGVRTRQHRLCERFAELHPTSEAFLLEKMLDPNPVLAAYAFKCWILVGKPVQERIPAAVLSRTEPIKFHSGCFLITVPLGEWIADYWKEGDA
jgi:hypothetical protein